MKLQTDLSDRDEILASISLMQTILAASASVAAPAAPPAASVAAPAAPPAAAAADAAAVFGGAPAAPLVPSIPPTVTPGIAVPPPPGNTASITPTPGPASSVAGVASVELDTSGLPWDERINTSNKAKTAKGIWKRKPGLEDAQYSQIQSELNALAAAAAPAPGSQPWHVPVVGATPAPFVPPAASSVPVVTVAPSAAADPTTFEQLMPRITAAVTAGLLPAQAVGEACVAHGLPSVVSLQTSPQYVPLIWALLKQVAPRMQ